MSSPQGRRALPSPARILVRGVNWLGDAVMTTPALQRLREAYPAASITIATPAKFAELWLQHPAIDDVLPIQPGEGLASVGRRYRCGRFDLAVVLPNSPRSAMECWLGCVPRRVGLSRPWRRFFLTEAVPVRPDARKMYKPSLQEVQARLAGRRDAGSIGTELGPKAHHSLDYLHLVAAVGADPTPVAPRLVVTPAEMSEVRSKFGLAPDAVWLGLNPGAEYGPAKRYPASGFAAAARRVASRLPVRWVLLGGPRDTETTREIAGKLSGALDLAGRTNLRELMAVLSGCRAVLTNDTGPMHVAAGLGIPVVVPFGSTSPELTGPGHPGDSRHRFLRGDAPCAPCFLRTCPIDFRCMTSISPERVADAVADAMRWRDEAH